MTEWVAAITVFVLVTGFIFGWGWRIIQDVKKSAHARIQRLEDNVNDMEKACEIRLATYSNKDDVKKVEHRIDVMDKDMKAGFASLTGRIDDLLLTFSHGQKN